MATNSQQQDWRESYYSPDELKSIYLVAGGIVIGLIGVFIGALLFAGDDPLIADVSGYWMNISTQIVSIIVIILGVNWLAERRGKRKQHLPDHKTAIPHNTILEGSNLDGADLSGTGLAGALLNDASLEKANLQSVSLLGARLKRTHMHNVNLREADLSYAKIVETDLTVANLERAILIETNLQGSVLWCANLRGVSGGVVKLQDANLWGANLQDANLTMLNLTNATMPNGETYYEGMDLEMFTNPDHPNFWRSDDPRSPAYRGYEK